MTPKRILEIRKWLLMDSFVERQYIQWPTQEEKEELCQLALAQLNLLSSLGEL